MHTVWVTQTDCALLSIWVHSYVSDITATYCCTALSSRTEHIVWGAKLEICWKVLKRTKVCYFAIAEPGKWNQCYFHWWYSICLRLNHIIQKTDKQTNNPKKELTEAKSTVITDGVVFCPYPFFAVGPFEIREESIVYLWLPMMHCYTKVYTAGWG